MKSGKTSAAILGVVGGLALGGWIGAEMTMMQGRDVATSTPAVTTEAAQVPAPSVASAKTRRVRAAARTTRAAATETTAVESTPKLVMTIPVSAPELHARMKPVLARGTKLPMAVEGFTSAEQFATLAHAARNTQVPFILLKHRVLSEGQSLEDAIAASKTEVDARVEALKAKGEARADILSLATNSASSNN